MSSKVKITVAIVVVIACAAGGYFYYLYRQGAPSNYAPPPLREQAPRAEIEARLRIISRAVDAYYLKNLRYPARLEDLRPDFLARVPRTPDGGEFRYESDGTGHYRVAVAAPGPDNAKELAVEDGKIIVP